MKRRTVTASIAACIATAPPALYVADGFVETRDGQRLAYRDTGNDSPVVFIHGRSRRGIAPSSTTGVGMADRASLPMDTTTTRCRAILRLFSTAPTSRMRLWSAIRWPAAAIAGSRIAAYEGTPHGLFITDRERFNDDLLRFVRS